MALPASGFSRPRQSGAGVGAGSRSLAVVAVAAVATLLALAVLAGSTWRGSGHVVTLDMPGAPAAAGGEGRAPAQAAVAADPPAAAAAEEEGEGEGEGEPEAAAIVGDPAFFETPMRVIRRSNIRARPTPESTALGRADEGAMVILVGAKPERGYFRVATGELEGWIWGANLAPADPTQQPDPAELPRLTAPDAAEDEPAAGR